MKKFILFLAVILACQIPFMLVAQDNTDEDIIFNAELHSTLNLILISGGTQTIDFITAADYNSGVTEFTLAPSGIDPGFSEIQVEATQDWLINITCPPFTGTAGTIPIDNLGVWCSVTAGGVHTFGAEVESSCTSDVNALGLADGDQLLIDNGTGNMGTALENQFTLHWEMGTMRSGNANPMNPDSMFEQIAANLFGLGTYTTTATLTLVGL